MIYLKSIKPSASHPPPYHPWIARIAIYRGNGMAVAIEVVAVVVVVICCAGGGRRVELLIKVQKLILTAKPRPIPSLSLSALSCSLCVSFPLSSQCISPTHAYRNIIIIIVVVNVVRL